MSSPKLRGKIREVYGSQAAFATAMGKDFSTISLKLNERMKWTWPDVVKACGLLGISLNDAPAYFPADGIEKTQQ